MTKKRHLRAEEKPAVIACAESYGIERASTFYDIRPGLVEKWLRDKDKVLATAEARRKEQREYARKRYAREGTTQRNSQETRAKWFAKHVFKHLIKTIGRRLRDKGYKPCSVTPLQLASIAKKQRCRCALSGVPLTAENISPDHVIPLSKGGSVEADNIQLVTKHVNYAKNAFSQAEFIEMCRAVVLHSDPAKNRAFP
jgi:hypothetical protein